MENIDLLQGLNIYLVGMMGSGKSTIATLLAKRTGYRCLDTDELIERVAQKTIADIFNSDGEAAFRDLETQILERVAAFTRTIVATGGGIVLKSTNWGHLRQGLVIWLSPNVDTLESRLTEDTTRPLLQKTDLKARLQQLEEQRHDRYALADLKIDIDNSDSPENIVDRILAAIPSACKQKEAGDL
jgi:shikimate kinase